MHLVPPHGVAQHISPLPQPSAGHSVYWQIPTCPSSDGQFGDVAGLAGAILIGLCSFMHLVPPHGVAQHISPLPQPSEGHSVYTQIPTCSSNDGQFGDCAGLAGAILIGLCSFMHLVPPHGVAQHISPLPQPSVGHSVY